MDTTLRKHGRKRSNIEIRSDAVSFARTSRKIKQKGFQSLSSQGMGLMLMNMSLLSGNIWRLLLLSGDIEKNPGPFPKVCPKQGSPQQFSFSNQRLVTSILDYCTDFQPRRPGG